MAFGNSTFGDIGGAASDIFAGLGDQSKQQYDYTEAETYGLAANLADQNEQFTQTSTAIKLAQQQREASAAYGGVQASVAGAGFTESGSALDILRDSASQAALTHAVLGQQGLITEAGYKEQAQSDEMMEGAAIQAGNAEGNAATGAFIGAGINAIAAVATMGTGGNIGNLLMGGGSPTGL